MSTQQAKLRVPGLTHLERIELQEYLNEDQVRFEQRADSSDRHGDLGTTAAIVLVSVTALKAFTAWLLATHHGETIERDIVVEHSDGRREQQRLRYRRTSSEAPDAAVLKQLGALFHTDRDASTEPPVKESDG